ncbi:MAG TPA: hypothetical protein VNX01_14735 [Bacteroidia bacterium]|nr:hypothetical protein [Bacteroidia bacterium]
MNKLKGALVAFILFFISCFYFEQQFGFIKLKPLDGIKELARKPKLMLATVSTGAYQDSLNNYLNENLGFRPYLVRMLNQLQFSLFNTTKAPGVVIGKNGMLFIESYINNYTGVNFVGKTKADELIRKTKQLQDSLAKNGVDLYVVFAPGKATYYSEYIPDYYLARKKDTTNYSYYSTNFIKSGINFIDFNKYFKEKKETFAYPIYPEYGTHWTSYGSALAVDSIIKYIEQKKKIDMPDFTYRDVSLRDSLNERDYDVGILLNLPSILTHKPMPYLKYTYDEYNKVKPDVLVVGDSYWWGVVGEDIPQHLFKEDAYWYYNKERYIHNVKTGDVNSVKLAKEIAKRDVIILMTTEATYDLFPFGFIDKAYEIYCLSTEEKQKLITAKINSMSDWKKSIVTKAAENHISVDEQMKKDVDYVVQMDYTPIKKPESYMIGDEYNLPEVIKYLEETKERMKRNSEWMAQIKLKAKGKNISIEKMMDIDAKYIYDTEVKQKKIEEIKERMWNAPEWIAQIKLKAKERNLSFEKMMDLDAKYLYDTEVRHKK